MRKVIGGAALPVLALTAVTGCTAHHVTAQARRETRPPAAKEAPRPPAVSYVPCTAAQLTSRRGVVGMGAGQIWQYLVLTNRSGSACTLSGGPSTITGVRRDGRRVRLASGGPRDEPFYGLAGPASIQPGQSAQAVLHTTDMCIKAQAGRVDDYIALDIGIDHSGHVRVNFPAGRPYDAICGVDVSAFGIGR